jgi:hypothetical protein
MVAGGLMLSLTLVGALWLNQASDLWWTTNTQAHVRLTTQQVMNRLVDELRMGTRIPGVNPPAPSVLIPALPNNTTLTCYLPEDTTGDGITTIVDDIGNIQWNVLTPMLYVYVPATRQLERRRGAETIILATDVQDVRFEDRNLNANLMENEVRITLTLSRVTPQRRTVQATAVETVRLRN